MSNKMIHHMKLVVYNNKFSRKQYIIFKQKIHLCSFCTSVKK